MRISPAIRCNLFCFKEKQKRIFTTIGAILRGFSFLELKERKNGNNYIVNPKKLYKLVDINELSHIWE